MPTSVRRPSRTSLLVLAALMTGAAVLILHAGRGTSFFFDEWDVITARRGTSVDTLLRDHNGHLTVLPVIFYKVMLKVFGLGHYWPYRLALVLLHLVVGALVFLLARRRAGDAVALCAAALVLFLGAAWEDLVWAFQVGFVGSVAAGLGMLLALDRDTRRADLVAAVLLAAALACSSQGVPFVAVAVVDLAFRRRWDRLARVVVVPVVLYGLWRIGWGSSDAKATNLDDVPSYAFGMLSAAVGALSGLGITTAGPPLAVAVIAGVALVCARGVVTPRLAGLLAGLLALWLLTALARGQLGEPQASRYIYPSAVLLLLTGAELWPAGWVLEGRALAVVGALVGIACLGNVQSLSAGASGLHGNSVLVGAELRALELAGDRAPWAFQPDPSRAPQIVAGRYRSAVSAFGSPAPSEAELAKAPEAQREAADDVLRRIESPALRPAPLPGRRDATCRVVPPGGQVDVPADGITVATAKGDVVTLRLRRFADAYTGDPAGQVGGGASRLTLPADGSKRPWHVQVTGRRPARACTG